MKIIGRTEAGARLVEISTEELIRINSAAQTLNSISLELGIVIPAVPLAPPVEQSEKKKTKERKTQAQEQNCRPTG